MKAVRTHQLFALLLLAWFLINLLQSVFTEITNDEAYYALWGQFPAWGYYDHPPMIGWLMWLGNIFFDGNLSVRFPTIIMQIATLLVVWKLLDISRPDSITVFRFFAVAASMVMFTAYGFITTPDVPLLFFTAVTLLTYKQFLLKPRFRQQLLLAIAMAGVMYSKYQGGLLILLIIMSNPKLLIQYRFWVSGFMALLLFLPHMLWQWQNDFPSFQYHLIARSKAFEWKYLWEYWPNQLAVFNPFTLYAVFWVLARRRMVDSFERAQYFIIIGFLLFFFASAIRGHVEPHWTIAASIAMIYLIMMEARANYKLQQYLQRFVYPSLFLILFARVVLLTDWLPDRLGFHSKEDKYLALEQVAGTAPVVFTGSFQAPSLYRYFTEGESHLASSLSTRRTQYDLWKFDETMFRKQVFVLGSMPGRSQLYDAGDYQFEGFFTDSLQMTHHLECELIDTSIVDGRLQISVINRSKHDFRFDHSVFPVEIFCLLLENQHQKYHPAQLQTTHPVLKSGEQQILTLLFDEDVNVGSTTKVGIVFKSFFGTTLNSKLTTLAP